MQKPPPVVTLLTDFGEDEDCMGTMKGIMQGIVLLAQLIDQSPRKSYIKPFST